MEDDSKTPKQTKKRKKTTRKATEEAKIAARKENATVTPTPGKKRRKDPPPSSVATSATPLEKFKATLFNSSLVKIFPENLLGWTRSCFQSDDGTDTASAPNVAKRARNGFESMSYSSSVKPEQGKSRRLAEVEDKKRQESRIASADTDADTVGAVGGKLKAVVGDSTISFIPSSYTVESTLLRRYLLEDIIAAPVGERVVFCVERSHPEFYAYKEIYDHHDPLPLIEVGGKTFMLIYFPAMATAAQGLTSALTSDGKQVLMSMPMSLSI